jgi:CheY-like chemotaxis protein
MKKTVFRPEGFMPRVLVVDDDPAALSLVDKILRADSCLLTSAESGEKALLALRAAPGGFDIIIVDAMMPDMDGFELISQIRANPAWSALPVLMLTRKRQREDFKKALAAGAADYIMKPIDPPLLKEKVRHLVGRRPA